MILNIVILFVTALLGGIAIFFIPRLDQKKFKTMLAFSGAYLFAITVIHILPELFHDAGHISNIGIFVLAGFFLQMVLEYFTSGVEHGHIHTHEEDKSIVPYTMLISLCLHAFLEGTLLVHPTHVHEADGVKPLLFGLVLHKVPEAFALMSVLVFRLNNKIFAVMLLLVFALASPAGVLLSNLVYTCGLFEENFFRMLFALVAGNFLYISTTIFFETSPNHKFKANKLLVSLLGALAAVLSDFFMH